MKNGFGLSFLSIALCSTLYGAENDSWETILANIKDSQTGKVGILYDTNTQRTGTLYGSSVVYQFSGANADGDFQTNESVDVTVTNANGKVISTGKAMTPTELSAWADKYKNELLESVFSNDPDATVSGSTSAISAVSEILIEQTLATNRERQNSNDKNKVAKEVKPNGYDTDFHTLVMMDSEKSTTKEKSNKAKSTSFRFSYDTQLESGNDVGAMFAYKSIKADDGWNSKSKKILLSPYYKTYFDITDKIDIVGVANLVVDYKMLESSLFPEGLDYMEYGFGLNAVPTYFVNDKISLNMPIGLQTIKKYIKDEVPEELKFITSAINDLGFQSSLNYGIGGEYAIKDNWFVNADILKTQALGSNTTTNKDDATYYNIRTVYHGELWNYVLGYKTVRNIEDFSEDAYMLSVQYNW